MYICLNCIFFVGKWKQYERDNGDLHTKGK